jgi:uncharacterized membrane protein HdeD (DUF308 family)
MSETQGFRESTPSRLTTRPQSGTESPLQELAQQISDLWWVPLITGLASIGIGLAILATDWTLHALVILVGLVFIFRGIALAFSPAYASRTKGEQVAAGLIGVIAGIVLVAWPRPTLLVLAFFVGAWLAVSGCFHIITSIARRRVLAQWGVTLTLGIIELLLGIWAMRRPEATLNVIIVIIGLWAVITGVIYCVLAFEIRSGTRAIATTLSGRGEDAGQVADRLDRLAQMRAKGMLSAEEYAQLKDALLARLPPESGGRGDADGTATPAAWSNPETP